LLRQGAWAEAAACLHEAVDLAANMGSPWDQVWPQRLLAELDLLQERPTEALARLQGLLGREEAHDVAYLLPLAAWAQLQVGHLEEAATAARQAVARATAEDNNRALPEALRVRALVATALG